MFVASPWLTHQPWGLHDGAEAVAGVASAAAGVAGAGGGGTGEGDEEVRSAQRLGHGDCGKPAKGILLMMFIINRPSIISGFLFNRSI